MDWKKFFLKFAGWTFLALFLTAAAYGFFFVWKINQTENKINANQKISDSFFDTLKKLSPKKKINLNGMSEKRINILLLGVAGTGQAGKYLTDTLIIASINPETGQTALLSIPRDLFVKIPGTELEVKINTVYQYGMNLHPEDFATAIKPIKETIENITTLEMNYWIIVDFKGFEKIVDAIGGITLDNKWNIYDPHYPGPNFSYETFELKKGFHHLDGATALKYARLRHNDPEGDFGRAKRQQQVLQAIKNRVFSTGTFLNVLTLNRLFNALGDNLKTNIKSQELESFLELSKKLDTVNVNNAVVDAWNPESLLIVSHIFYGNLRSFILIPRIGNWNEIRELAQNIFNINALKRRREEIAGENPSVIIINKSGNDLVLERIGKLLKKNLGYKNTLIVSPRNKNLEDKTLIYDFSNGNKPFSLDELTKKLPAEISQYTKNDYRKELSELEPDILVVIGKDLIESYNMEEDSLEEYNSNENVGEYQEFLNK
jgi:LCP family protein required for cell wall assembly